MFFQFFFWTTVILTEFVNQFESSKYHWTYSGNEGRHLWCKEFQSCCDTNMRQSPIDIKTSASVAKNFSQFELTGYDKQPKSIEIINDGHSLAVHWKNEDDNKPMLNGGGLPNPYYLQGFHFHWGSNDGQGSEHLIDGKSYPAEVHFVHSKYKNFSLSREESDGLAVVGVFFQIEDVGNAALDLITKELPKVQFSGEKLDLNSDLPLTLRELFPSRIDRFYRYNGSLTTPTCDEIVIWTVFEKPQSISTKQLNMFRILKTTRKGNKESSSMNDNFRPVQELKGRDIYRKVSDGSSEERNGENSCDGIATQWMFTLSALLLLWLQMAAV